MIEKQNVVEVEEAAILSRDFVMARNSARRLSDGWARLGKAGLWRVRFERLDGPIMDPFYLNYHYRNQIRA